MSSSVTHGMDVDRVRAVALSIQGLSARTAAVQVEGSNLANVLEQSWKGHDATAFIASWAALGGQVEGAADHLRAMASGMLQDADQQDSTSGAGTGASFGPGLAADVAGVGWAASRSAAQPQGIGGGGGFGDERTEGWLDDLRGRGIDRVLDYLDGKEKNPLAKVIKKSIPFLALAEQVQELREVQDQFYEDGTINPRQATETTIRTLAEGIGTIPHPAAEAISYVPELLDGRDAMHESSNPWVRRYATAIDIFAVPMLYPALKAYDNLPDRDIQVVPKEHLPTARGARSVGRLLPIVGPAL